MHHLAVDVLKPKGRMALLTGDMETRSFPGGRKALGVIQGDAVPQRFIPKLIDLFRAGLFLIINRSCNMHEYVYNKSMRFTWDERKRKANIKKHGIDFADAPKVFT